MLAKHILIILIMEFILALNYLEDIQKKKLLKHSKDVSMNVSLQIKIQIYYINAKDNKPYAGVSSYDFASEGFNAGNLKVGLRLSTT